LLLKYEVWLILETLLHFAEFYLVGAGNSDPDKLKEQAEGVQKLSADELLKRRMEIKVKNTASGSIL
jgi:hypothetical protein